MTQRFLLLMLAITLTFGCATSKKAADTSADTMKAAETTKAADMIEVAETTVEEWSYMIKDLPDGDTEGTFTLTKTGDSYTGMIHSAQGDTELKNIVMENNILKCSFSTMGYNIGMTGTFEGDAFTGKVSAEGYDFPMTAVKKR